MKTWRKAGFDHFSQWIEVVVRNPTIETSIFGLIRGTSSRRSSTSSNFFSIPLGGESRKLIAKTRHFSRPERDKHSHPQMHKASHFFRNEIMKCLRNRKTNRYLNNFLHCLQIIFFKLVCQSHSRLTPFFRPIVMAIPLRQEGI